MRFEVSHQIPSGIWCCLFQWKLTYIWGKVLPSALCVSGRPFTLKMEVEVPSAMLIPFCMTTLHNNTEDASLCFVPCLQHPVLNWYPWTVSIQCKGSYTVYLVFRLTLLSVTVWRCNSYHCFVTVWRCNSCHCLCQCYMLGRNMC